MQAEEEVVDVTHVVEEVTGGPEPRGGRAPVVEVQQGST